MIMFNHFGNVDYFVNIDFNDFDQFDHVDHFDNFDCFDQIG